MQSSLPVHRETQWSWECKCHCAVQIVSCVLNCNTYLCICNLWTACFQCTYLTARSCLTWQLRHLFILFFPLLLPFSSEWKRRCEKAVSKFTGTFLILPPHATATTLLYCLPWLPLPSLWPIIFLLSFPLSFFFVSFFISCFSFLSF